MWRHTDRGWAPQEETGTAENQRWVWKNWARRTVCCKLCIIELSVAVYVKNIEQLCVSIH